MPLELRDNVVLWHNVRAQLGAFEGTKTAALPTFGPESRSARHCRPARHACPMCHSSHGFGPPDPVRAAVAADFAV